MRVFAGRGRSYFVKPTCRQVQHLPRFELNDQWARAICFRLHTFVCLFRLGNRWCNAKVSMKCMRHNVGKARRFFRRSFSQRSQQILSICGGEITSSFRGSVEQGWTVILILVLLLFVRIIALTECSQLVSSLFVSSKSIVVLFITGPFVCGASL